MALLLLVAVLEKVLVLAVLVLVVLVVLEKVAVLV